MEIKLIMFPQPYLNDAISNFYFNINVYILVHFYQSILIINNLSFNQFNKFTVIILLTC